MTFGEFTAGDEFGWGPDSVVYAAEPAAGGGGKPLALKVRGYQQEMEGSALLEAGREQQRAVAAGCSAFVPIFALGLERHSYYSVSPRYPRSLFSLIQGKVSVRPEGLEHIAAEIFAGLRQLREKQGRAHGNLKSSNILLTGIGRLRDADALLSDLSVEKTQNYAADVNAFGVIVYQVIRRREVRNFDWPIAHAAEWAALGPRGEAVRTFCNDLLDPAVASASDPLAAADRALAKLGGRARGGLPLRPIAMGLAVVALAAGAWLGGPSLLRWLHSSRSAGVVGEAQAGHEGWVGRLADELAHDSTGAGGDAYLQTRLLAPLQNLHLSGSEIAALRAGKPPSDAAAKAVSDVTAAFDAWDARKVVSEGYDDLAGHGWTIPAGSISRLRGDLAGDQPVLPQLRKLSHAATVLPEVQVKWRLLQDTFTQLKSSGDPVLAKAPEWLDREAAGAPDLDRLLATLNTGGDRLGGLLPKLQAADRPRLEAEGKLAKFDGAVTDSVLHDWEEEARRYTPDPAVAERLRASWKKSFDELSARIPAGSREGPRLLRDAGQAEAEAEASLGRALPGDAERIDGEVQAKLAALSQRAEALAPPPAPTVAAVPAPPANPTPGSAPPPMTGGPAPALPQMAPGDQDNFDRLLAQVRAADFAGKSGGTIRTVRDDFLAEVRKSTSPAFQKEISGFLLAVGALSFPEGTAAPSLPGWQGPVPSPAGVSYIWGKYKLEFTLIRGEGGERSPYFLAAQEFPIGLLIDWMNEHGGNWAALDLRPAATVRGPRAWEPRAPGIAVRRDWMWPSTLAAGLTFYPPPAQAALPEPPSGMMPLNYVSCRAAANIATQFGCRLPTPEEWGRAYRLAKEKGWVGEEANLRDARWELQRAHVAGLVPAARALGFEFRDPPWPDGDIFIPSDQKGIPRADKARPARSDDDHSLWFHPVNAGPAQPLSDLLGNIAEFASEGDGARCFVLGGSALSPPELDPATPYALSPTQKSVGFSDVGLRLALSAGGGNGPERDQAEQAFRRALASAPGKKP